MVAFLLSRLWRAQSITSDNSIDQTLGAQWAWQTYMWTRHWWAFRHFNKPSSVLTYFAGFCDGYVPRLWALVCLRLSERIAGWNAWYNWFVSNFHHPFTITITFGLFRTIVLPAELSAAAIIASYYVPQIADPEQYNSVVKKLSYATTSVLVSECYKWLKASVNDHLHSLWPRWPSISWEGMAIMNFISQR